MPGSRVGDVKLANGEFVNMTVIFNDPAFNVLPKMLLLTQRKEGSH